MIFKGTIILLIIFSINSTFIPKFISTEKVPIGEEDNYNKINIFVNLGTKRELLQSFSMRLSHLSNIVYSNDELASLSSYVLYQAIERLYYAHDKEFVKNLNQEFSLFRFGDNNDVYITNPNSTYAIRILILQEKQVFKGVDIEFVKSEGNFDSSIFQSYPKKVYTKEIFFYGVTVLDKSITNPSFSLFLSWIEKNRLSNLRKTLFLDKIINQDPLNMFLVFTDSRNSPSLNFSDLFFDINEPTYFSSFSLKRIFKNIDKTDLPVNMDSLKMINNQIDGILKEGIFSIHNRNHVNINDFLTEKTGWLIENSQSFEYPMADLRNSIVKVGRRFARRTFKAFYHDFMEFCVHDKKNNFELLILVDLQGYNPVKMQFIRFSIQYISEYNAKKSCVDMETIKKNENKAYNHYAFNRIINHGIPLKINETDNVEWDHVKYLYDVIPISNEFTFGEVIDETKKFYIEHPFYNFVAGNCQHYASQVLRKLNTKDVNGDIIKNTNLMSIEIDEKFK